MYIPQDMIPYSILTYNIHKEMQEENLLASGVYNLHNLNSSSHPTTAIFCWNFRTPSFLSARYLYSLLTSTAQFSSPTSFYTVGNFHCSLFTTLSHSSLFSDLKSIADTYSLWQTINDPTHFSLTVSPSIIDLAFIPSTFLYKHPSPSSNLLL